MNQLLVVLALLLIISPAHADEFPKKLTAHDAIQYFAQHPKIVMRKPGSGFDFKIRGNDIERYCAECHTTDAYGTVRYRTRENKVCFDWEVSFPDSGCFTFVQVSPGGFELQNDAGERVYAWGSGKKVVIQSTVGQPIRDRFERAILIDLEDFSVSKEQIHAALVQAMKSKGWQIDKDSPEKVTAYLERQGVTYRVMGKIQGAWVGIGFIEGYSPSSDSWLYNLQKQFHIHLGH